MGSAPYKVAITTGDTDGIGLEVTEKALLKIGPKKSTHFLIWRSAVSYPKSLKKLATKFKIVSFFSPQEALNYFLSNYMKSAELVEIISSESPARWVEMTAKWCFEKRIDGMVTGPISKTEIHRAGLKDMGHTDILKRIAKTPDVFMGFMGAEFNVLLATAHIPIHKVSTRLDATLLLKALRAANQLRATLAPRFRNKPIVLLGLNPHAGEDGLIGTEEQELFPGLMKEAHRLNIPLSAAFSPDAAFFPDNWRNCSVYLAMYHDQGLIPFKLVHGQNSGVHISVGLPFVRTSVDHGTAKDLYAKNKANPASMCDAIQTCLRLIKSSIN